MGVFGAEDLKSNAIINCVNIMPVNSDYVLVTRNHRARVELISGPSIK